MQIQFCLFSNFVINLIYYFTHSFYSDNYRYLNVLMKSIRQQAMSNDCLVRAHETRTEECRNIESEAHRRSVTEPSSQEVMFSQRQFVLFICQQAVKHDYAETSPQIYTKFNGKSAHGPVKKRLDFVSNPDLDQDPEIF